jgi:hypothetical protein
VQSTIKDEKERASVTAIFKEHKRGAEAENLLSQSFFAKAVDKSFTVHILRFCPRDRAILESNPNHIRGDI